MDLADSSTCFHIQGPQTVRQHFNTGNVQSQMLRAAAGVRMNFFRQVAQERFSRTARGGSRR